MGEEDLLENQIKKELEVGGRTVSEKPEGVFFISGCQVSVVFKGDLE